MINLNNICLSDKSTELYGTCGFVPQVNYWIDANKKVHYNTDCLFMMPAYRHDNKLKCIYDVLSCSSEHRRSGWDSGNEKTRIALVL